MFLGGAQLLTPVQEARMSIEAAPYKVDTLAVSNQARHLSVSPCRPCYFITWRGQRASLRAAAIISLRLALASERSHPSGALCEAC